MHPEFTNSGNKSSKGDQSQWMPPITQELRPRTTWIPSIGASAYEDTEDQAETQVGYDNPIEFIEAMEGIPDDVRDELKRGYLRQSDYTKKTQALSDERRSLEERRSVVDQILLSQNSGSETQPEAVEEKAPDMADGASPEDVINYYVNKAVKDKLNSLGLDSTVNEIKPLAAQQRVVRAYKDWAKTQPDVDHNTFAATVGQVIDSDPDLTELAESNPERAIRIAAKVARANVSVAQTKAKSKKRHAAAPVASRKGSVVSKKKRETALEAATRALKEQGF